MIKSKSFSLVLFLLTLTTIVSVCFSEKTIQLENLPLPASGAYFVTSAPLSDGTYLVWNGYEVFKQSEMNKDEFIKIAEGYQGDPGFIAISPNNDIAILGQGYLGDLYRFELSNPQNFTPDCIVGNISHFYGAFLTSELLILDVGKPDFSGSEIHVINIAGGKSSKTPISSPILARIFIKPKEMVIDKPLYAYSATIAVDREHGWVYIMDSNARELRRFNVSDIINAYNSHTTLDWENDGTLIGEAGRYFSGGVSGITNEGLLIIGGSEGFMMPGGIQEINPYSGEVVKVWDPAGNHGYYSAFYNTVNDSILGIVNNTGYLILRSYTEECPDCIPIRRWIYEAGTDICLDIYGVELPENPIFRWSKLGENIEDNPRIRGITCRKLLILNAQPEDSGTYICTIDSTKSIYRVTIKVTDREVPISDSGGLIFTCLAIITIGIAAVVRVRKLLVS